MVSFSLAGGMRKPSVPTAAMAIAFSVSTLNVAAYNRAEAQSAAHSAEPAASTACLSLDRYSEDVDATLRSTDWSRLPNSPKVQHGTRTLMSEFLVFKE